MSIEVGELGDVSGKSLLHLQCHFGLDTMSWARRGASVTGVDFSPEAIRLARLLAAELNLDAKFVESNIYDLPNAIDEKFDVVFTSYGVLGWLPDINGWAEVVSQFLKPGGTFYIVEFHPFANVFDDNKDVTDLRVHYSYFHKDEPMIFEPQGQGSYASGSAKVTTTEYSWHHTIGDIVSALVSSGLRIKFLHEFPKTVYKQLPFAEKHDDGFWRLKGHEDDIPLIFSLKATK